MTLAMTDDFERLVQRFLDGELTRHERRQLLERMADDPDLRERLVADETMLDAAASLRRPTPSSDFVARTVARLPVQDEADEAVRLKLDTTRTSIAAVRLMPDTTRASIEGVRLTADTRSAWSGARGVAAAAAVVLLGIGFLAGRHTAPSPPAAAPTRAQATGPAEATALVQFMLLQPDAQSVVVVGDFNGWDPARSPLEKRGDGVWGTTLTLPPGRYHYQFLIDGTKWVADPLAGESSSDGFGARNSVLDVEA